MSYYTFLDNLDAWFIGLEARMERLISALIWNINEFTILSVAIMLLFILYFWAFVAPCIKKKLIQARHRRRLNEKRKDAA